MSTEVHTSTKKKLINRTLVRTAAYCPYNLQKTFLYGITLLKRDQTLYNASNTLTITSVTHCHLHPHFHFSYSSVLCSYLFRLLISYMTYEKSNEPQNRFHPATLNIFSWVNKNLTVAVWRGNLFDQQRREFLVETSSRRESARVTLLR